MYTRIKVATKAEAAALDRAWNDPATQAFVKVIGYLQPLSPRARARVLTYISDLVSDPEWKRAEPEPEPATSPEPEPEPERIAQ